MYNFEYTKDGLKAEINKDKLTELMKQDQKEEARIENKRDRISERCDRTEAEQGYKDTGMRPSDF